MENKNLTGISPTQLGRERKRYDEMLKLENVTSEMVTNQMRLDAQIYTKKLGRDISFETYKADIDALSSLGTTGKREADKVTRDELVTETLDLCGVVNLAIAAMKGEVTLSQIQKAIAFDTLGAVGNVLANHMDNAFDKVGALTMIHAPHGKLCVHVAGWDDGSKTQRYQYAPRKLPISKRSGYRDDSFAIPQLSIEALPPAETEKPNKPSKQKTESKSE